LKIIRLCEKKSEIDDELIKELNSELMWTSVDSSLVDSVRYFKLAQVFSIKLKNGNEYTFYDVDKKTYDEFMASESKGKFFNKLRMR
jgi:hypothetical protein